MKKFNPCLAAGLLLTFLLSGCFKDHITHTYRLSTPVYKSLNSVRTDMKSSAPVAFTTTGKISVLGNYIFLSEVGRGIHVIDNTNQSSPKNLAYISVPGNEDIAIKDNMLYADSYSDLVVLDISDPKNIKPKKFVDNVFPDHGGYSATMSKDSVMILVDWVTKDTTVDYDPTSPQIYMIPNCASCQYMSSYVDMASAAPNKAVNGSMARFAVVNDYLYTVSYQNLNVFNVSVSDDPTFKNSSTLGWGVETIYPFGNWLFIGSNNGVFMYDISANPETPKSVGQFAHARSCDPVITDGTHAFVTLSDGTKCQGFENQMDIVDVSKLAYGNSALMKTYPLTHPLGLSKDGNTLFVCDGADGLKVFDASDVMNLKMIQHFIDTKTFDIVAMNGIAIVVGSDGIYEYDYTDLSNIHFLSKLSESN